MTNFIYATPYTPYAFNDAAVLIRNRCTSFAGCAPSDLSTQFVYSVLRDAFLDCEDAIAAVFFDCVCKMGGEEAPCSAVVSTTAEVRFIPKG